mgnify:CR=1 FL=1
MPAGIGVCKTLTDGRNEPSRSCEEADKSVNDRSYRAVAVDLGASNGRVVLGTLTADRLEIDIAGRFEHSSHESGGRRRWDWPAIEAGVRAGLATAADLCRSDAIASVSCSSWAQDFGLLDAQGNLFYPPVSYRDDRTQDMPASFAHVIAPNDLIARVGCGATPVTTLCQLRAMTRDEPDALRHADTLLFVADLVHHALCGAQVTDRTLAAASQMRRLADGTWDEPLLQQLGIPHHFLPPVVEEPRVIGRIPRSNPIHPRLDGVPVYSVAGHDTSVATACLAPLRPGDLFLNLGTWAMLGGCNGRLLVPDRPGDRDVFLLALVRGRWGIFKAGAGLWLLQECQRHWRERGLEREGNDAANDADRAAIGSMVDPADPRFHAPADMPGAIAAACLETGQQVPRAPAEFARVIFNSLARHYAAGLAQLCGILGVPARTLRVLCGGSRNACLCRAIARAAGVPVLAGPAEATAIGNILLQAEAAGIVRGEDHAARILDNSFPPIEYVERP